MTPYTYIPTCSSPSIHALTTCIRHLVTPTKPSERPSCLFISLDQFVSKLSLCGIEEATQCFELTHAVVHTPREVVDYNSTKCSVILALLQFVAVLLTKHPKEAFSVCLTVLLTFYDSFAASCVHTYMYIHYFQNVPESFWTEPLLQMVVVCCLQPTSAGFDIGDVSLTGSLSTEVCIFLYVGSW